MGNLWYPFISNLESWGNCATLIQLQLPLIFLLKQRIEMTNIISRILFYVFSNDYVICNTGIDEKVKRIGSLSNKLFRYCYIMLKIQKIYWPHINYLFCFSPINRFCLCCHFNSGNKRNHINVDSVNKCPKLSSNIMKSSRIGQRTFVLWLRIEKQSIDLIFYSFYAVQSHVILNEKGRNQTFIFFTL